MSPVAGLALLPGQFLWCVHYYGKFQLTGMNSQNTTKRVKHKLALFATVITLWILVTLITKLIRIPLKWKYMYIHVQDQNYAILVAILFNRFHPG